MDNLIDKVQMGFYKSNVPLPVFGYKRNHVFDENMSVKWNNEEFERRKAEYRILMQEYKEAEKRKETSFYNELCSEITENFGLSDKQAAIIADKAWRDNCGDGLISIVCKALDFASLCRDLLSIVR